MIVRDNFYEQPKAVYQKAITSDFYQPEHATGYRSRELYHEKGIKQRLEKLIGIKITRWDLDPLEENGVFYQGFSEGNKSELPGVHSDEPYNDMTVLVYLTPNLPFDCGTSFWQHRATGLTDPANSADAKRLKMKLKDLQQQLEKESKQREKWIEIDRVGYRFNRLVVFPSGILHSATRHFGEDNANGRLYQTIRLGVDWSTFKLGR